MGCILSYPCAKIDNCMHKLMFMPPPINKYMYDLATDDLSICLTTVKKSNQTISLMIVKPDTPSDKFIVFSHGNAATIYDYYYYGKKLASDLGVNCIFYDYPGYGLSSGTPTDESCVNALEIVVLHMMTTMDISKKNIILIGQSIGTGITTEFAHKYFWLSPIILLAPFKSIVRIATETSTCITKYVDKYPSIDYVKVLNCPIRIFHGTQDEIIPFYHGTELAAACRNKTFSPVWLDGIGHNNILDHIDMCDLAEVVNYCE